MIQAVETPRSVLIVDDDLDYAESLADILVAAGCETIVAATAEDAMLQLRGRAPEDVADLVALLDVRLGVTSSGVNLLSRFREERPDLVCVMMTAELDSATAIEALRRGAYDYFDKLCEASALLAVIERCFEKVRLRREQRAAYEALRAAKDEAEAANRAKSDFLATMNHELRTPLNAIIGFSEMMLREVRGQIDNEHYRSYVGDIHSSGIHLLEIIQDILDLSKAEAGKLHLSEDVFDVRDTVRAVGAMTAGLRQEAGLSANFTLPEALPLLRADERKTRQVLFNLIGNAVKFTPTAGRIDVSVGLDAEAGLAITISDTGIGIAAADMERVLRPFERVDNSLSRRYQGTGLGLPLVKAIMELHGGSIRLQSELWVGTAVTVVFPRNRIVAVGSRERPRTAA
jgi:signal transduction histidine kinase